MPDSSKPLGILLVNLGTPDAPTPAAVRRYLKEFLSDSRVVEIPRLIWWAILTLLVLPLRSPRVAKAYASIWETDSPMRRILSDQAMAVACALDSDTSPELESLQAQPICVLPAMTYGKPSLSSQLDAMMTQGIRHILVLPLFPQYSATTTAAIYDSVQRWTAKQRDLPALNLLNDYHDHPLYIQALAESVRRYQAEHGVPEKLLLSFHGIPQPYADKGDPYPHQCHHTARLLASLLKLADDQWAISFQSRFGKQEWVKPYTDVVLADWGQSGVRSVQVISPAFSADCLETLEELAVENREHFLASGGQEYGYIPALNTDPLHIELLKDLARRGVRGLVG